LPLEFSSEEYKEQEEKKQKPKDRRMKYVGWAKLTLLLAWGLPLLALLVGFVYLGWPFMGLPRFLTITWSTYGSIAMIVIGVALEFAIPKNKRRWF
jgi:hypothetical protein